MKDENYQKGYKDGQKDLIQKWNKWRFGIWFFKQQRKQLNEFMKHYDLDTKDIEIIKN